MSKPELIQEQNNDRMLASIHRGVAIILWAVLTHTIVWPIASVISGYRDEPILSLSVMSWSAAIAAVIAFLVTRFVFPVNYAVKE